MPPYVRLDATGANACKVRGQGIAFLSWSAAYTWMHQHGYRPAGADMREWRLA